MRVTFARPAGYSRAEYVSDIVVHAVGIVAVLACVPMLIAIAAIIADEPLPVAGVAVYGLSFAAMIGASALYNVFPHPDWEWMFKRLDHSAIYLKIAGTVTAFAALAGQGLALVLGLWTAAGIGIVLKLAAPFRFHGIGVALCLAMGWSAGILGRELFAALPAATVGLIGAAGGLYTVGVVFHLWRRLPFHNTIWHLFVLAASLALWAAALIAVLAL